MAKCPGRSKGLYRWYEYMKTTIYATFLIRNPFVLGITYVIEGLKPDTSYLVRVASRNPSGLSDWMGPAEFMTQPSQAPTTGSIASCNVFSYSNAIFFIHLVAYIIYD